MSPRTEWRVTYRRAGWAQPQARVFQTQSGARRFMSRLLDGRPDLGELMDVRLQRRDVGPWIVEEAAPGHVWSDEATAW